MRWMRLLYGMMVSNTTSGPTRLPGWTAGIRNKSLGLPLSYAGLCDRINERGWSGSPTITLNSSIASFQTRWVGHLLSHKY